MTQVSVGHCETATRARAIEAATAIAAVVVAAKRRFNGYSF